MKLNKGLLAAGAVALAPLCTTAAHAGYDAYSGAATGSRSMNRPMRSSSTTTYRRYSPTTTYRTTRYSRSVMTTSMVNGMTMMTVSGTLTRDADDKNFEIVDAMGRTYLVNVSNFTGAEAANKLQKGQMVRVHGEWSDNTIVARNVRLLSATPVNYVVGQRVYYAPYYYTIGSNQSVTGTLVTDADDDEFQIRDAAGRVYMIRTRNIPDSFGLNKLQEGQMVRVYGYWFVADDRPQLEATNVTIMR